MGSPIVTLGRVKKYYGSNKVLDGISLKVEEGEVFGIIGASGSGKTTLLNTLIGFLKPDAGSIEFHEKDKAVDITKNPGRIKRRYGFASQHPSFYLKLTVAENLEYFGSLYKLSPEGRKNNINTLLEVMELDHAKKILAKNLSGGMQRRLDIACSIVHNPDILFLDEPTADLDPVLAKHIWNIIRKINKIGTTVIVASHELREVENVCSRVGILHQGKLQHVGTVNQLKNLIPDVQEIHIETYPGDYTKLKKALKSKDITKFENKQSSLVIHTKEPQKVLNKLLKVLKKQKENLIDIRITKLQLTDVFKELMKKQ